MPPERLPYRLPDSMVDPSRAEVLTALHGLVEDYTGRVVRADASQVEVDTWHIIRNAYYLVSDETPGESN